jgi:phosphohistidine phosphatase
MKDVADGLLELVEKVDVISVSPLLRAQQTAAIIANAFDDPPIATVRELLPEGDPSALEIRLRQHSAVNVVAIIGHEPHLGILVTWLMSGVKSSRVAFSKGSACLLEFPGGAAAGGGTLQWLLTPSQLRRIGR